MEVKALASNIRISPRKMRLVAGLVRKMEVNKALNQLAFCGKKAALPLAKLINSAVANAVNNFNLDKDNLYIKELRIDEGKKLKRWLPRARGRATLIRKRASHIKIVLSEIVDSGSKPEKKQVIAAPIRLSQKPKADLGVKVDDKEKEKSKSKKELSEKNKKITDISREGRHGHSIIEGGAAKGFVKRIFRRKSG